MNVKVETVYGASKFLQNVSDAPASVTIVTADEIERYSYRTLAEILASVRGFYVIYDRNYTYVGVRGFSRPGDYNARILFLIDGHRHNDDIYDGSDVGTVFPLDIGLIDHVEIIRGPGSAVYGTGAVVAVVNVVTRRGRDLNGLEISGQGGSWETYKVRMSYGKRFRTISRRCFRPASTTALVTIVCFIRNSIRRQRTTASPTMPTPISITTFSASSSAATSLYTRYSTRGPNISLLHPSAPSSTIRKPKPPIPAATWTCSTRIRLKASGTFWRGLPTIGMAIAGFTLSTTPA